MANTFFNWLSGSTESVEATPSSDIDDRVIQSERILDDYYERAQDWRDIAKKNDEYRYNNQLSNELRVQMKRLNQSPAAWNLIHNNVELAKQFLTHKDPKFQTTPREDSDVQMARASTMVLDYVWDHSDGNIQFEKNTDDFYVRGPGVYFVWVDPSGDAGRGEIHFKAIDPFKVFIDPNAQDIFARDASHIIYSDLMTAEQLQRAYGSIMPDILEKASTVGGDHRRPTMDRVHPENPDVGPVTEGVKTKFYEVIDRYSKVFVSRFHVVEKASGKELVYTDKQYDTYKAEMAIEVKTAEGKQIAIDDDDIDRFLAVLDEVGPVYHYVYADMGGGQMAPQVKGGEPGPDAIPNSRIELRVTTKGEVINEIASVTETKFERIKRFLSAGRVFLDEQVLEIDTYPIVPAFNNHSRNPYPLADVYFVRELQDYYNKIRSDIAAHLANAKSTRVLIPRGSDREELETLFQRSGVSFGEYDADIGMPVVVQPVPLAGEVYAEPSRIEKKVQDLFGIYGVSAGDPSDIPRTYNATLLLDDNAQRRMGPKIKVLYGQLNVLADVILQYAQQVYDKEKLTRILQPNFEALPIDINQQIFFQFKQEVIQRFEDWRTMRFDIKIVSGSTLPNNRWARLEYYMQMYQMGLVDDITVLRNTDIAELEEVIARKSQLAQAKQIISEQEEIIKDLEGDLQTADREVLHNQRRVELEKTKSKLKELEVVAEKDFELFADRLDDSLRERKSMQSREAQASPAGGK